MHIMSLLCPKSIEPEDAEIDYAEDWPFSGSRKEVPLCSTIAFIHFESTLFSCCSTVTINLKENRKNWFGAVMKL